jgi:uncharacterized protein (TIGR02284 family)
MTAASLALNRSQIASALERLARLSREGEVRFRHAADRSGVDALREVLGRWARERARFASELEIEAQALGERPEWAAGSMERMRAVALEGDRERVVACRAGDETCLGEYERALLITLPVEVERLLRSQYAAIKDACDRMAQIANGLP